MLVRSSLLPLGAVPDFAVVAGLRVPRGNDANPTPVELLAAGIEIASPSAMSHPRAARSIFAKYARRAATRTSAFGYFVAFTAAALGDRTSLSGTKTRLQPMSKPQRLMPEASDLLCLNPTLYLHESEWRFHREVAGGEGSSRAFELASTGAVCDLDTLRIACAERFSAVDLAARLANLLNEPVHVCTEWIESAVDEGLFLHDARTARLVWGESECRSISRNSGSHEDDHWLVRTCDEGLTLSHSLVRSISDAISCLESRFPANDVFGRDLEERFRARFGGESVPLMRAVDPEDGLWPAPASHLREIFPAAASFIRSHAEPTAPGTVFGDRDEVDIETLPPCDPLYAGASAHPSILTVAFHLLAPLDPAAEPRVVLRGIDNSGGLGLLARAALSDEGLVNALRGIEEACAAAQSHRKVRAEIVHAPTVKSEWIGVRPSLVPHEIQLFARGQARGEHRVDCSELELRQINGRVVLWSPRLDCEIEPVQSSPLAHAWARLPVYRFLCQFQRYGREGHRVPELISEASWRLPESASARFRWRRAPALRWRNVILRECEWEVHALAAIARTCARDRVAEIVRIVGLPQRICIELDSERRELDLRRMEDCDEFAGVLSKVKPVRVAESLWCEPTASPLTFDRLPHANEFILPLLHVPTVARAENETVYTALHVYAAPGRSSDVLRSVAARLTHPAARGWFFTRMADPFQHLRIRVVHAPQDAFEIDALIAALAEELSPLGAWKTVRVPYSHEHERYGGPEFEESVTHLFALHTAGILRLPSASSLPAALALLTGAAITHTVLSHFGLEGIGLRKEADRLRTWALQLANDNTAALELLSSLHRSYGADWYEAYFSRGETQSAWNAVVQAFSAAVCASAELAQSLEKSIGLEALPPIAGRLAHMCLNRYFEDDAMVHELASHDLLVRCLRREAASSARASKERLVEEIR